MTNQFYSKNAPINIYIANLDEYNKGNLIGGWVSLPIDEYHFKDFLKSIGNPKAYAIRDYENNSGIDGLDIWIGGSIEEMNALCKRIGKINIEEIYILNALYEVIGDLDKALDCYESDKYVYYGCITIPSFFEKHIDYKSIARDMLNNGYYITDYGVIEIL